MNTDVQDGLWASLAGLILTTIIMVPTYFGHATIVNITRTLLVFVFFFGLTFLTEHAIRNLLKEARHKHNPTAALFLVLFSSTLMLFAFVGLALYAQ